MPSLLTHVIANVTGYIDTLKIDKSHSLSSGEIQWVWDFLFFYDLLSSYFINSFSSQKKRAVNNR